MQTKIVYDSQERCYHLIAGNGVKPGSYRKRPEAMEAQLALEAPEPLALAQRAAERYPVLARRALRAAQLVAAGKVHLDTAYHQVASQTCTERSRSNGAGEYRVERVDGTWRCSCPGWAKGLAAELSHRLRRRKQAHAHRSCDKMAGSSPAPYSHQAESRPQISEIAEWLESHGLPRAFQDRPAGDERARAGKRMETRTGE